MLSATILTDRVRWTACGERKWAIVIGRDG